MTSTGNKSTPRISQCKANLRELNEMILINRKYKTNIKYAQHSCFAFSENYPKCLQVVFFFTCQQLNLIDFCLYCLNEGLERVHYNLCHPTLEKWN